MSGSRKNTKRSFTQKDTRSFYLVASDLFYGLVFSSSQNYTYKINRSIVTNPSFVFYDNQTKVLIDYSNSKNNDDLYFIQSFFNSLSSGITFEYSNATYVEDASDLKSNLSGIYTFTSFEQGKIIKANVTSVTNVNSKKDSYFSKFFTKPPQISKASGTVSSTQQKKNVIKNTLSKGLYSFEKMGVRIGDYIEFTGMENNSNKKMKVLDIFTDSDGFETIQVDVNLTDEKLIGSPILVNLYLTGESTTKIIIDDKSYGSCILTYSDKNSICIPCQNAFLCNERRKQLNAYSSSYVPNATCDDDTVQQQIKFSQTEIGGITFGLIGGITQSQISEISTPVYIKPKSYFEITEVKKINDSLTNIKTTTNSIETTKNVTLKIIVSDPTLLNTKFKFSSTDPTQKISEITNNVIAVGLPGTSNSYYSIKTGANNKTIYFGSTDKKLSIPIVIK